ncbi:hypothetical protein CIHG_10119 [Coccidioides immitis H538.4]|uniref:Uncharacterized protein n=1 Tax=Coccidioides immitis H538.4 TaxID=396776 RepID=A0A0J8S4B0_COCIT|nr:hypothetical protein CIHG_10119 [Coccidioides immitis H538.4]
MPAISISTFAQSQQHLLLLEHEAEIASSALASSAGSTNSSLSFVSPATRRALQAAGHALTALVLVNCRTGMGGREVGEFGVDAALKSAKGKKTGEGALPTGNGDGARESLPAHGIRVGDVVRVEPIVSGARGGSGSKAGKGKVGKDDADVTKGLEGVVTKIGERSVWVAFDERGRPGKQDDDGAAGLWGQKLWLLSLQTYRERRLDILPRRKSRLLVSMPTSEPKGRKQANRQGLKKHARLETTILLIRSLPSAQTHGLCLPELGHPLRRLDCHRTQALNGSQERRAIPVCPGVPRNPAHTRVLPEVVRRTP